jgi:nucleotide-binding universal stress UspA family protein
MKKIICITDFSSISDNAVQYAAQLALDTNSKLVLLWLQNRAHEEKIAVFNSIQDEDAPLHTTKLSEACDLLRGVWGIRCDYKEIPDLVDHAEEILDSDVQMVIMGIEAPSDNTPYRLFSGIDFKVVRNTQIPVLLVPETFRYKKLTRILYAFDYVHNQNPPLDQLQRLAAWLRTDVRVLSVVQTKFSSEEEAKIDGRNSELQANWKGAYALSFDSVYYPDIAQCLEHYMKLWRADDIIVFSIGQQSFTDILFHKGIIQQMTLSCEYPILIIHR